MPNSQNFANICPNPFTCPAHQPRLAQIPIAALQVGLNSTFVQFNFRPTFVQFNFRPTPLSCKIAHPQASACRFNPVYIHIYGNIPLNLVHEAAPRPEKGKTATTRVCIYVCCLICLPGLFYKIVTIIIIYY